MNNPLTRLYVFLLGFLFAPVVFSKLEPLPDSELSEYTGQAFITIDEPESITEGATKYKYTRINFGMDIDTILTIDELELGRYSDSRDINGAGVDIDMKNVALGGYFNPHDYFEVNRQGDIVYGSDGLPKPDPSKFPINPETGRQFRLSDKGVPMPFNIKDPFIEFAYKQENGVQSIAGVRIGFGGAKGTFTTDIASLSGNLDVIIQDNAQALASQDPDGFFGVLLKYVAPILLGDSELSTRAILQQGPDGPNPGQALDYRATHIGVEDGTNFRVDASDVGPINWFLLQTAMTLFAPPETGATTDCTSRGLFGVCTGGDIDLYTDGCELAGIETCFPLNKYQSLDVGNGEEARGLFLGLQTEALPWRTDVFTTGDPSNPIGGGEYVEGIMRAGQGFYLNIPTGGINLDLKEAVNNGLPRQTTRYTDASLGLF
ncbi:hypothetical protein [Litoribacillus peritrichatus]|uniref:Uncharacterized protein n=1 Tax=Litoribacillus peritrichatus TaxID=718191 RepID=A0ABP7NAZ2_9GAMM